MQKKIINSGVKNYALSYHGIGVHDKFTRTSGAEENLRNSIRYLKIASEELNVKIRIKIGHLITELSYPYLDEIMRFCEDNELELYLEIPDTEIPVFAGTHMKNVIITDNYKITQIINKLLLWKKQVKPILMEYQSIPFINRYMQKKKLFQHTLLDFMIFILIVWEMYILVVGVCRR